jgi:hypothetical protein
MTKVKVEKFLVISFIGLIVTLLVGLGGNIVLKAGLPASVSKTGVNFEKRLQSLEDDLVAGNITRYEYDSVSGVIHLQMQRAAVLREDSHNPERMPDWVIELGISEPDGMKFDQVFSNFTSSDDPSEGFNSVSLVYTGNYEKAIEEAAKIASAAKLFPGGIFRAKGSPVKNQNLSSNPEISYLNYSLGNTNLDFLISIHVEPSGRLTIMVTNNRQLNERLLVYGPLNNRQNGSAKQKKQ